ncbi:UPF0548 protein [Quillaja saponaria]|uniref:UPF0548 protein n=1 Tax=Quillaja saponaria TaxID=32244 RepID=A0AAD7P6L4_QUISA|nr:UPF0548 protein [Quillaja saponaria]
MVFLCWNRPSPQDQKSCIEKSGGFNYDTKYRGATAKSPSSLKEDKEFSKEGFLLNHSRVLVGSGVETFEKGKSALHNWRHFGMNWSFVDPKTPIRQGEKLCVCVKEFFPWLMMPLQVVYVNENRKKPSASFGFGSGTLKGHLLAGEERFSIELDENNQVWRQAVNPPPLHSSVIIKQISLGYEYIQIDLSQTEVKSRGVRGPQSAITLYPL